MSMIMQIARGSVDRLEQFAEQDEDAPSVGDAFGAELQRRQRLYQRLTPEGRAQLEAIIYANPQLRAVAPQLVARLRGAAGLRVVDADGDAAEPDTDAAPSPETIDLHKSWHVFHYLFTGESAGGVAPANFLFGGGREVGEDRGYGPGHLLDVAETAAVARFLAPLSVDELQQRIDAPRMAQMGIYCAEGGDESTAEELADDVEHYFPLLQAHVQAAADAGQALFVWLT
jgi:hypothetical protein